MLWTQTNPGLCALAQMAPRSQTALVSGLGDAVAQATGRQPNDLCYRQRPRYLPEHGPSCCCLIKPKPFRPGRGFQNVQTLAMGCSPHMSSQGCQRRRQRETNRVVRNGSGRCAPMNDSTSHALLTRSSTNPSPIATPRKTRTPSPTLVRVIAPTLGDIGEEGTCARSSGCSDILSRFLNVVVWFRRSRISM